MDDHVTLEQAKASQVPPGGLYYETIRVT